MIANYGYSDAEGDFYITVDTYKCERCLKKPCIDACPSDVFLEEEDPCGEMVIAVGDDKRRKLRYECMACKPSEDRPPLPCVTVCPYDALAHSW